MAERRWTIYEPPAQRSSRQPGPLILHCYAGPHLRPGERVDVVPASTRDALLADLQGEVERLRDDLADEFAEDACFLRASADRLQALIDKHAPSSKPSTEEVAAEGSAAPRRSSR